MGYTVLGIRGLTEDENYKINDICRNSYDWDYENDMSSYNTENPVELNGTCAMAVLFDSDDYTEEEIEIKIQDTLKSFNYSGKKVLVGGNRFEYGADPSEVIIEDAKVIRFL